VIFGNIYQLDKIPK